MTAEGNVQTSLKQVGNNDIANLSLNAGEKLIEGSVTAGCLNAQNIFGETAIIKQLIAQNIDVSMLFARAAVINELTAMDLTGNNYLRMLVDSTGAYRVEIESTADVLSESVQTATLTAKVYWKNEDVTDSIAASGFAWTRKSNDATADAAWNTAHSGMKSVTVTVEEITNFAAYECAVTGDAETVGRVSVTGGYVDDDGYLQLNLTDGRTISCGKVRGQDGADGQLLYATFSIVDNALVMYTPDAYAGPSFQITNGSLEVVING